MDFIADEECDQYVAELLRIIAFRKRRLVYFEKLREKIIPELNKIYFDICLKHGYDYNELFQPVQQGNNTNSEDKSKFINKIYKKLSLVFHPDKTDEFYKVDEDEIMVKINQHYKNNDLYELLMIATQYQIDFSEIEFEEYVLVLEKKIYQLDENINTIINSEYYPFMMNDKNGMEEIKMKIDNLIKTSCELKKETNNLKNELFNLENS